MALEKKTLKQVWVSVVLMVVAAAYLWFSPLFPNVEPTAVSPSDTVAVTR